MSPSADPDLLTIAEAARLLRVSTVTLHRWLKQGRLPSYRVGPRAVRLRRDDLRQVVAPARREEVLTMKETQPAAIQTTIRPLTEEEKRRGLNALAASLKLGERIRARRGGRPVAESWPLIREAREERSRRL